jgi:hypothetical protein
MMTYNPPYYAPLIEVWTFPRQRFVSLEIELDQHPANGSIWLCNLFRKRQEGITVRPVSKKTLEKDLHKIKQVYTSLGSQQFRALTDAEIDFMAERMKPFYRRPGLSLKRWGRRAFLMSFLILTRS